MKKIGSLLIIGAMSLFLAATAAAQDLKIKVPLPPTPKIAVPKPPAPKVKVKAKSSAPGVPRSSKPARRYNYYPEAQVYFDPARSLYFFLEANRWAARAFLPPEIKVRVGAPVVVELGTDQPYEYHEDVIRVYPGRHDDRHRSSYREGFDDGYEEGYGSGYDAGYQAGYDRGYRDGFREGYHDRDRSRDRDEDRRNRGRKEGWDLR